MEIVDNINRLLGEDLKRTIPEALDIDKKEQKTAARFCDGLGKPRTISEVTKERLRRAGQDVNAHRADEIAFENIDIGFRVLKIDTSNMSEVYYAPDAITQDLLSEQVDKIRAGRTPEDWLFQVLLDWGVDLTQPIAKEVVLDKRVLFVDGDALVACFEPGIDEDFVKQLATRKPLRVVFRDSGFANDGVKINVEQIFKLMSPATEIKTI